MVLLGTAQPPSSSVLVTGGTGFIGSVVTQQLVDAGHRVLVVDNGADPRHRRARAQSNGARYLDADLQRIVVASSSSVYRDVADGFVSEDRPVAPLSPYGVSKAAVEWLVRVYAARGVPAVSLRFFSVYGRGQRPDMALAKIIDAVTGGDPFPLRGSGPALRDLTHVDDVSAATRQALFTDRSRTTSAHRAAHSFDSAPISAGSVPRSGGYSIPISTAPISTPVHTSPRRTSHHAISIKAPLSIKVPFVHPCHCADPRRLGLRQ